MEVRFRFAAEVFIEGDNMREIREKFEDLPLFSADALENGNADFVELEGVEDADTYDDLMHEYDHCYDGWDEEDEDEED